MIAGLEPVTSGTLRIGDRVVNDIPAKDRDIAMVFQSYALYPHMTVRKNIESPLLNRGGGIDSHERARRVGEAADLLSLGDLLDRKPAALSGGQRQRVALARAIVRRPEVFLMDEPLSNLDAKLRTQTRLELVDLWRRLETTFVYVTHDQVEAMTMASRIAIMNEGRLQQVGEPQAVYDRPANLFVAGFIGSPPMNLIDGTRSGARIETAAGSFGVTQPGTAGATAVVAGVRPESTVVGGAELQGRVINVEMLGHERHVICQVGSASWTVRQPVTAPAVVVGEAIGIAIDPNHVHLFDRATGARVN
jgi:multiple sugar transport system ATP-binding protein